MNQVFDTPITTNDQSIDRVLRTGLPVVFIFQDGNLPADLESAIARSARENAGKLLFARVPLKDNPTAAERYAATAPFTLVTVKAEQALSKTKATSSQELERHVAYILGRGPKPVDSAPQSKTAPTWNESKPASSSAPEPVVDHPIPVTDATFEREVFQSSLPVVVDFWAPWCGPCRMVEPTLVKLAKEQVGRLRIVKMNVDENPLTAQRFGIQSIPTMIVVGHGKIQDRWMGALPEPALRARVTQALGKA